MWFERRYSFCNRCLKVNVTERARKVEREREQMFHGFSEESTGPLSVCHFSCSFLSSACMPRIILSHPQASLLAPLCSSLSLFLPLTFVSRTFNVLTVLLGQPSHTRKHLCWLHCADRREGQEVRGESLSVSLLCFLPVFTSSLCNVPLFPTRVLACEDCGIGGHTLSCSRVSP